MEELKTDNTDSEKSNIDIKCSNCKYLIGASILNRPEKSLYCEKSDKHICTFSQYEAYIKKDTCAPDWCKLLNK